ncbi:MAG TPA: hypothetical protein VGD28_15915 [Sphingomonas sp.]
MAAIESVRRFLDDLRAGTPRLLDHLGHFLAARHVMAEGEGGRADGRLGEAGVVGDVVLRPDRQPDAPFKLEEGDRAMLIFAPDDALARQPEAVAIEGERAIEIGDAKRQDGKAGSHRLAPGGRRAEGETAAPPAGSGRLQSATFAANGPPFRDSGGPPG